MKRIYSIDLLKLYFAFVIAFGHFELSLPGDSFAVKLFFVISGFFLAKKFYSKSYIDEGLFTSQKRYSHKEYTLDHIKQLYPDYLFALLVMVVCSIAKISSSLFTQPISTVYLIIREFYRSIPEIFMIQEAGFFSNSFNYPAWQLCTIIICGYFIYTMLYYCEKLSTELIFPVLFIFFETYWIIGRDPFAVLAGFIPSTLARGFAMMALGVLIYKFSESSVYAHMKSKKLLYNIFSLFVIAGLFIFKLYNGIHIIGMAVIVLYLYNIESWANILLNRSIFKGCGKLSYSIYLNHAVVIYCIRNFIDLLSTRYNISVSFNVACIVFGVVLTLYSVFTIWLVNKIKLYFAKKQQK